MDGGLQFLVLFFTHHRWNRGIGAAAARRIAEFGAPVVLTGRRQSEGRLLVKDIKRHSGSAGFIQADLSEPEQVKRIVPFTLKPFGRLDYALTMPGSPAQAGVTTVSASCHQL